MPEAVATRRARQDLAEIARFTQKRWGRRQRHVYVGAIIRRLYRLAEQPERDRPHPDIRVGFWVLSVGRHLAVYKRTQSGILLVRVLHQSMDFSRARIDAAEEESTK